MDNQVGGELRRCLRAAGVDDQLVSALLDRRDGRAHAYINAEVTRDLDELRDEIGVVALQRALTAVENRA